jgi:hypothetical protein
MVSARDAPWDNVIDSAAPLLTDCPGGGPPGLSDYTSAYEAISAVMRLEEVDPSRCE